MQITTSKKTAGPKVLLIMGLFVSGLCALAINSMFSLITQAYEQGSWIQTNCLIVKSEELTNKYGAERVSVEYTYNINGQEYSSTKYRVPSSVSQSDEFYRKEVERFAPGTTAQCFYDPKDKSNIVLSKTTWGSAMIILVPGLFLAIGLGLIWLSRQNFDPNKSAHITRVDNSNKSFGLGLALFFSLFIFVGLGLTYLFFGMPYLALKEAKNWSKNTCTIQSCSVSVSTSRDSDGDTSYSYHLDLRYEYQHNNSRYIGETYSPAGDSFFGKDRLYEISSELQAGKVVDCYYSPANPYSSAINIETPRMLWGGLFPLIFTLAGLLGMLATSKPKEDGKFIGTQKVTRKSASRIKGLITYLLLTVIWNGLTGAVVYAFCFDSKGNIIEYLPILIAIPFVLIGALLIIGIPYVFLQLFNPKINFELSTDKPTFNSVLTVKWNLVGNPNRVKELEIVLTPNWGGEFEGRTYHASDRINKKRLTDKEIKINSILEEKLDEIKKLMNDQVIPAYKTTSTVEISNGQTEIKIPGREAFNVKSSDIELQGWQLKVSLKIPWYPDAMEIHQLGTPTLQADGRAD